MEFKSVTVYHNEIKVPSIYGEFPSRFDLLFVTMKLMGYDVKSVLNKSTLDDSLAFYSVKSYKGAKYVDIDFGLCNDKVVDLIIMYPENVRKFHISYYSDLNINNGGYLNYPLCVEEDILKELDEVMSYI